MYSKAEHSIISNEVIILSGCQDFKRAGTSSLLKEKGREQFLAKKGQFALYKEKLEKWSGYHKLPIKILKKKKNIYIFLKGRAPPGSKRAQGRPPGGRRAWHPSKIA
jgi:hypothetical protein